MKTSPVDGRADTLEPILRKIAHDIVGPTSVASGALKELERQLRGESQPHASMLDLVDRSLQRLQRLATRLRSAALVMNGTLELESQLVVLGDVLAGGVAHASKLDGRKNVTVEVVTAAEPIRANADEPHLALVFSELMSNALRFARRHVRVTVVHRGERATVDFEDDGAGFPAGLVAALTSGEPPSIEVGFALPLVVAITARFGGAITFGESGLPSSSDGRRGARVRVELPVASA